MRKLVRLVVVAALAAAVGGCRNSSDNDKNKDKASSTAQAADTEKPADGAQAAALPKSRGRKKVPPPPDVAAPPADAVKTQSGIHYKVLSQPTGDASPGRNDNVHVNYTGWKTDGEMFFTSTYRSAPQPMSLAQTAPGWTEALTLMKMGEKRRYWIPAEIAYRRPRPGAKDMLVFEIELVKIDPAPPVPPDVAAVPADATKTKSGLAYKVLAKGTGNRKPTPWDQVTVHYSAWGSDGGMFDSTVARNRPRTLQLFREMKGWQEAFGLMVKGQKMRVWIPPELVDRRPNMPEGTLVYEVELLDVKEMPKPPPVPKDIAAPPQNAKKTAKGVSYVMLAKGKDGPKATADKVVTVNYSGWTTDGEMFDSSVVRGKPAQFALINVIEGWRDGMQVMSVGDRARFWIPEELAYQGKPNRPQGMLVFEVELLEIKDSPLPIGPGGKPSLPPDLLNKVRRAGGH